MARYTLRWREGEALRAEGLFVELGVALAAARAKAAATGLVVEILNENGTVTVTLSDVPPPDDAPPLP